MVRIACLLLVLLLLGGCAGLQPPAEKPHRLIKPPANAAEAVEIANGFARRGRWSDALDLLDAAVLEYPQDSSLQRSRDGLQARWEREERQLQDLILVGDAENQKQKIGLLEKLSRAEPDNLIVMSRRIYWKEVLVSKALPLTACGEQHAEQYPSLARRCFELASAFNTNESLEHRLAEVDKRLQANEQVVAERRRVQEAKERQLRAKVLLHNAKAAIEAREYRQALDTLDQVAELQPDNIEVPGLKATAWSMISPQVEALVKLGDHLYLDEQLDAAVATWQAALSLKPDDEDIQSRIERARSVLSRLDELRRKQNSNNGIPSDRGQ